MNKWSITLIVLALTMFAGGLVEGESAAAVKARLTKRLPAINALKEKGLVGENNKGYLEARGKMSESDAKVVAAENADRKYIYTMLARKVGQPVEVVGARRAAQIAKKSKPGLWIQQPDGTWVKKK